MNIETVRTAVGFIAARSVSFTVNSALKNLVLPQTKLETIQLKVGAFVVSGMVADAAITWAEGQFDQGVKALAILRNMADHDEEAAEVVEITETEATDE